MLVALLTSCGEYVVGDDSVLENPNAGEFGHAGQHISKEYNFLFEIKRVDSVWFLSKVDTIHKDSALNFLAYDWPHAEEGDSLLSGIYMGLPSSLDSPYSNEDSVELELGYVIPNFIKTPEGLSIRKMYSGKIVSMEYKGLKSENMQAFFELNEFISDNDLILNGPMWSEYANLLDSLVIDSTSTIIRQPVK